MIQELLLALPLFSVQASTNIYTPPSYVSLLPSSGTPNIGTVNANINGSVPINLSSGTSSINPLWVVAQSTGLPVTFSGVSNVSLTSGTSNLNPFWVVVQSTGIPVIPQGITPISLSSGSNNTNPLWIVAMSTGLPVIIQGVVPIAISSFTPSNPGYVAGQTTITVIIGNGASNPVGWSATSSSIPVHEIGVMNVALASGSIGVPLFVNLISSPAISLGRINTTISSYWQASTGTTTIELKDSNRNTIIFSTVSMPTTSGKVSLSTWSVYSNGGATTGTASYVVTAGKKLRLEGMTASFLPLTPTAAVNGISTSTLNFIVNAASPSTGTIMTSYTLAFASAPVGAAIFFPQILNFTEGIEISSNTVFAISHKDNEANFGITFSVYGYEY